MNTLKQLRIHQLQLELEAIEKGAMDGSYYEVDEWLTIKNQIAAIEAEDDDERNQ